MDIDKAIKKQKKSYKRFMFVMVILLILLPLLVCFFEVYKDFLIVYLIFLEIFIVIVMIKNFNNIRLEYTCENGILKIKPNVLSKYKYIYCDRVGLVHTENELEDVKIIIVFANKGRKGKFGKQVGDYFCKVHPGLSKDYNKMIKLNKETQWYYIIIKRGALKKFKLLDDIYKNCVTATYTNDSIENIKIARGQKNL